MVNHLAVSVLGTYAEYGVVISDQYYASVAAGGALLADSD